MIASVKDYARARMVSLGYVEWNDVFNIENIPATQLDYKFHVELGVTRGVKTNQTDLQIDVPFTVRLFKVASHDTNVLADAAITEADTAILEMVKVSNRLDPAVTGTLLKNITFNSMELEPLADSDDNGIVVKMEFTASVFNCTAD